MVQIKNYPETLKRLRIYLNEKKLFFQITIVDVLFSGYCVLEGRYNKYRLQG